MNGTYKPKIEKYWKQQMFWNTFSWNTNKYIFFSVPYGNLQIWPYTWSESNPQQLKEDYTNHFDFPKSSCIKAGFQQQKQPETYILIETEQCKCYSLDGKVSWSGTKEYHQDMQHHKPHMRDSLGGKTSGGSYLCSGEKQQRTEQRQSLFRIFCGRQSFPG